MTIVTSLTCAPDLTSWYMLMLRSMMSLSACGGSDRTLSMERTHRWISCWRRMRSQMTDGRCFFPLTTLSNLKDFSVL